MKKLLLIVAALAMLLPSCKKFEDAIETINGRLDAIENSQITSLQQQIDAIKKTLPELEKADKELKEYIGKLETTAVNLQKQIDDNESKIKSVEEELNKAIADAEKSNDALKAELVSQLNTAKADVLAQLEAAKTEMNNQLAQINQTIQTLQTKDEALDKRIDDLTTFVNTEIHNLKDWTSQTFATIAQYNALADEVATIKESIASLNSSIAALEKRLTDGIAKEIAQALEPIKQELITEVVTDITTAYTSAISDAKSEITAAYTAAIAKAINSLESSLKSWVNEQLEGYYTMAQTDAKLALLQNQFESQLESQKIYLTGLINSLGTQLEGEISANQILIEALQNDVDKLEQTDAKHAVDINNNATAISKNAGNISKNASDILANANEIDMLEDQICTYKREMATKISEIESHLTDLDADVASINDQIEQVRNDYNSKITALQNAMEQKISANTVLIDENKQSIDKNTKAISENKSAIAALKVSTETAIAQNAENIATNAENIAKNAALIAQNANAISNNANAIAQNAADILQLQQDLADAKTEITAAYKAAIKEAIETLDGELRDHIATEVATINTRIDNEVATINATIAALTERVVALEKEVKNIKVAIYNIQTEIANMQEQIEALIERIQSVSFVPDYADGKATMYYTNSAGVITAGSATLKYEIRPASVAEELVDVWEEALSVKAVYTQTRAAAGEFVNLAVESASATDGILTVVVKGDALADEFFRSEMDANVRLEISNGYNCITSEYVNMVPWTTNTVYIPDANFKAYLLTEFDTNSDNEISLEEAENIKEINISATLLQVKSIAGIEYFSNLEKLDCSYNRITSLDLAGNTKLTEVNVSNNKLTSLTLPVSVVEVDASVNQLTTIDVSHAKTLTSLNVLGNKLGSLNVSQNKSLTALYANDNKLANLDVTKLLSLTELSCGGNNISTLNLTKNTALTALDCHGNNLTALDLTKNTTLESLNCEENSLTAIYLNTDKLKAFDCANNALTNINVATQTKLETLDCSHNALAQLDVTKCAKLISLDCSFNALQSLNVSNNSALTTLNCSNNANLTKLWVKDEAQQNRVAIDKDNTTAIFFNNGGLHVPDAALKSYLVANYDDDGDGEISIVESDNITMVNCSGKGVADLTGLEACTNLVTLNCSNNNITSIELPNLAKFTTLTCYGNPISKINLNNCAALNKFNIIDVSTNAVNGSEITIDGYTGATTMDFTIVGTPFTTFSFTNATALTEIKFYGDFTTVNLYGNSALEGVDVNPILGLHKLDIHGCKLQTLDVTEKGKLTWLDASANELTAINVTQNNLLEHLNLADNGLSVINVRNNTALTYFNINNNTAINTVNVTKNTALTTLYAEGLSIVDINLTNNNALTDANLRNNTLLETLLVWDACVTSCNDFLHFDMGGKYVQDAAGNHYGYPFSVGQYIPWFNGGVVYEISNDGANGKIISVGVATGKSWSSKYIYTGASSSVDGLANMNTIKALNPDLSEYPAFKWCNDYGKDDWYLPAKDESMTIYNNRTTLNSTLSANGYKQLIPPGYSSIWSSTENNSKDALYISDYGSRTEYKLNDYPVVRAVLAF